MKTTTHNKTQNELVKLGSRFRILRETKGLSQQQLAHLIDKDAQSIYRLEKGLVNPTYKYMKQVCEGLGVELEEVLRD